MFGLFGSSLEQKDGNSIWQSGLSGVIGMFVPAMFAGTVAGWASNKFGDKVPEALRPITDTLASIFNGVINFVRGIFAKEELEADKGLKAQFDANPALGEAAKAVGGTPAQRTALKEDLVKLVQSRIASDTGFWMSEDSKYAVESAVALRKDISDRLVKAYKENNKDWDQAKLDEFDAKANTIASAITGVDTTNIENVNTNTADKGYLGALLQAQRAVAAEGKLEASQIKPLNIPENIAQLAAAAAPKDVVPAPEGGAATTGGEKPEKAPAK